MLFNISVCFRRMLHISLILRRRIDKKAYLVNDLFPPQRTLGVGLGRGTGEREKRKPAREDGNRKESLFFSSHGPLRTYYLLIIAKCTISILHLLLSFVIPTRD